MSNGFESFVTLAVEVEVDVADVFYTLFRPSVCAVLNGVHSHEYVIATGTPTREPRLKPGTYDGLRFGDGLNRVARGAIPHEDRGVVGGLEQRPDILRRRERAWCKCEVGAHRLSCLAKNTTP